MEKAKFSSTPMSTSCSLDKNKGDKGVKEKKYRGIIGFLNYLTSSYHDIMLFVCMCACFQKKSKNHIFLRSNASWVTSLAYHL